MGHLEDDLDHGLQKERDQEAFKIDSSKIQTQYLTYTGMKSHYITIRLRGGADDLVKHGSVEDVRAWFVALRGHLSDHGFGGWRCIDNLLINMAEVQAVWISSETEKD